MLTEALREGTGRFDASDLMPKEVGQGTFWSGMLEYVRGGPESLDGILQDIEDSWPEEGRRARREVGSRRPAAAPHRRLKGDSA